MADSEDSSLSRTQQALGVGLGVSLIGAIALAVRYGFRKRPAAILPEALSPAIFATRVLPTTHGQIVYHTSGSGEPMVFLHGVYPGASSFEWSRVYPEFTLGQEVLALDMIGFGESERPAQALDLREQAQTLIEFLHMACGGRSPILVASGLGAKPAMLLAAQHPEFLRQLILWLPLGVRRALRGKSARTAMGISHLPWLRSLAWRSYLSSPAFFERWVSRFGFCEEAAEDAEVVSVLTNCAGLYQAESAIWSLLQGGFAEDLTPRLKDIRCPTSVLWPKDSPHHPVSEGEAIARELPAGRLRLVEAKGLLAPLRHPTFFKALLDVEIDDATVGDA